jgi:GT2 family glycosyltransferase
MTGPIPSRVDVSIVIVCMNQVDDLFRCLDGIEEHTRRVTYDIWVVAYLFSEGNLARLRARYPAVHIVESNEIRGFAENNNLALRQANGEYCFIVNDDTFMDMPVVDMLFESFQKEPRAALFSPKILNMDGSVQFCGGLPHTMGHWLLVEFRLRKPARMKSPLINGIGIFRTCTVMGAAFMVRTAVLQELGYFNERYFFCPEDSALSMLANQRGHACFVNADARIYHQHSSTLGRYSLATVLAMQRGQTMFHSRDSWLRWLAYSSAMFVLAAGKYLYWSLRRAPDHALRSRIWRTAMGTAFSRRTPKELFVRYYQQANAAAAAKPVAAGNGRKTWS